MFLSSMFASGSSVIKLIIDQGKAEACGFKFNAESLSCGLKNFRSNWFLDENGKKRADLSSNSCVDHIENQPRHQPQVLD